MGTRCFKSRLERIQEERSYVVQYARDSYAIAVRRQREQINNMKERIRRLRDTGIDGEQILRHISEGT